MLNELEGFTLDWSCILGNFLLEICTTDIRIRRILSGYQRYKLRISRENWLSNYQTDFCRIKKKDICWMYVNISKISGDIGQRVKNLKNRWEQGMFWPNPTAGYQGLLYHQSIKYCAHQFFCTSVTLKRRDIRKKSTKWNRSIFKRSMNLISAFLSYLASFQSYGSFKKLERAIHNWLMVHRISWVVTHWYL